ncbi:MAG: rod shape-determining protein MreD [Clostridia bacterium]|nr:rod shape-determining protein MreD [Clostridia bacterium]
MKPKLRLILTGILFLLLGLTEFCVGPLWWGCNPPYLLCAVVVYAMFSGEKSAALFGLFSGLFADSMTSGVFGLHGVMYLFFGYMIVFLTEKIISGNVFSCTITGILTVALNEFALWGIENLDHPTDLLTAAQYVFLPRLVMSLPLLFLLYSLFSFLFRERDGYSAGRRFP